MSEAGEGGHSWLLTACNRNQRGKHNHRGPGEAQKKHTQADIIIHRAEKLLHKIAAQMHWYDWSAFLSLCMARQQLWQACRKENNNRRCQMTQQRRHSAPLWLTVACRYLDFGLSCQIAFGLPQTPKVDSCSSPDITLITQTFSDIRKRTASGCEQLKRGARGEKTSYLGKWVLLCSHCLLVLEDDHFFPQKCVGFLGDEIAGKIDSAKQDSLFYLNTGNRNSRVFVFFKYERKKRRINPVLCNNTVRCFHDTPALQQEGCQDLHYLSEFPLRADSECLWRLSLQFQMMSHVYENHSHAQRILRHIYSNKNKTQHPGKQLCETVFCTMVFLAFMLTLGRQNLSTFSGSST